MDAWPRIRYAPLPLIAGPAVAALVGIVVAILAAGAGSAAMGAVALAALAVAAAWGLAVRRKLGDGALVALTREGDHLVGAELAAPVPVAGTTFAIVSDHGGGWLVVLDPAEGRRLRLQARGWRLPGGARTTREAVAETLSALGLIPRPR